jgi:phage portal protein BeeE
MNRVELRIFQEDNMQNQEARIIAAEPWVGAKEIASHFGVSEQWIQVLSSPRYPASSRLKATYFGRVKRFKISEAEKYFKNRNNNNNK